MYFYFSITILNNRISIYYFSFLYLLYRLFLVIFLPLFFDHHFYLFLDYLILFAFVLFASIIFYVFFFGFSYSLSFPFFLLLVCCIFVLCYLMSSCPLFVGICLSPKLFSIIFWHLLLVLPCYFLSCLFSLLFIFSSFSLFILSLLTNISLWFCIHNFITNF